MNYDKLLSDIFFIDDWHLNLSYLNKYKRHYKKQTKYKNIINYINNRYVDSLSFKETIYRMRHNCEIRPVCKTCGNTVDFIGKRNKLFRDFCSNKCSGVNKNTIIKKQNADKKKHNGKLGWNINTPEKIQARKDSLIKKYGSWENACKEIEKKHKEGVYKKYGVDSVMKLDFVKEKHKKSCLLNNTMFGTSKAEQYLFKLIKNKYPNSILHYKDNNRYPFNCDFYIPDLDMFIEYNGHQTHGSHPYNKNDINDKNLAERIREIFGDNLTFTKRDPYKRYIALKNNLNFIELWKFKEAKKFIENL